MLRVDVSKQFGEFTLEAAFESEGRVTGLFGASGAGKTSLVNMIAGLVRPDRGTIILDGETQTISAAIYSLIQTPDGDTAAMRLVIVSVVIAVAALIGAEVFARRATQRLHGN